MKFGLDKILFPGIYRRALSLNYFAEKMLKERLNSEDGKAKPDFMGHILNAREEDGTPTPLDKVELAAECIALIIGGK
jgi:hypothetical protein